MMGYKEVKIIGHYAFNGTYTVPVDQEEIEFGAYVEVFSRDPFKPVVMDYRKLFFFGERVSFLFGSNGFFKGLKSHGFIDQKGKSVEGERLKKLLAFLKAGGDER
jgi:hypothetical protein